MGDPSGRRGAWLLVLALLTSAVLARAAPLGPPAAAAPAPAAPSIAEPAAALPPATPPVAEPAASSPPPAPSSSASAPRSAEPAAALPHRHLGGRCHGLPIESLQRHLPYRVGDPIPPCYRVGRRPRLGFLIAGGSLFLLGYGSALAYTFNDRRLGALQVPLAGPYLAAARMDDDEVNESDLQDYGSWQIMGVAITALGVALQNRALIREDLLMLPAQRRLGRGARSSLAPSSRGSGDARRSFWLMPSTPGLGVGLGGRF